MKFAIISFAILLRILVGFQPHSGQDDYQGANNQGGSPSSSPQKISYGGDYEAQRHWMEITYHLPVSEWYWHDLEYWGLDYPPLTAYVSWVFGWVAHNLGSLPDRISLGYNEDAVVIFVDDEDDTNVNHDECQLNDDDECIIQSQPTSLGQKDDKQRQQPRGGLRVIKDLVALHSSRFGYEEALGKMYMRFTVLLLDLIIYMSAVLTITTKLSGGEITSDHQRESLCSPNTSIMSTSDRQQLWLLITALTQPALILIDHGHFQYNTVSLGLALWSFHFMTMQTSFIGPVVGSVLFSLALNFKQMELYHAPAVFAYLLGRCFCNEDQKKKQKSSSLKLSADKFCALGISVILTFALLWLPFALYPREPSSTKLHLDGIIQLLKRLFPFQRGVFEGKVSNIWCSLSIKPISIRSRIPPDLLPLVATGLTLVMILPPCYMLFMFGRRSINYTPKKNLEFLLWGSASTSIAFFLASFQVHEKGILIPLAPLSLLALDAPLFVPWFSLVASWSLWPLLVIDRLCEAYFCCLVIFLCITAMTRPKQLSGEVTYLKGDIFASFAALSLVTMIVLHLAEWTVLPPTNLPDLFPVLWSLLGCGLFCISYIATIWTMAAKNNSSMHRSKQSRQTTKRFFSSIFIGLLVTSGEAFSLHQKSHRASFFSPLKGQSDDLILTSNLLERARMPLPWEEQAKKDEEPVLNLSARNSDRLSLADGFCDDTVAASDENDESTDECGGSWEDGSKWKETERELVAIGILDNNSKLTRDVMVDRAPQLLRLPTDQILESARFFLGNSMDESQTQTLESLLQLDPSLLTYTVIQLDYGVEYLANMMTRGNRTAVIQMIESQCGLSPSMALKLLKLGVDGGIEESRISQLLGNASQSSQKAVKGVVGDMGKDIREWKRVKGGKNTIV